MDQYSKDVRTRIGMAKQKTSQLNNIWKDGRILTVLKMTILKFLVWTVVLYGCEAWTLNPSTVRVNPKRRSVVSGHLWLF